MRRCSFILFLAVLLNCAGCQGVSNPVMRSLNRAHEDYHRLVTGSNSSYIAGQRSQQ